MPVLNDLDEYKNSSQYKDRAQSAIKEILACVDADGKIRDGVFLEVLHNTFRHTEYTPELNPDNGDDQILMYVIHRKSANPLLSIVVATEDSGMKVRCRAMSVRTICPSGRKENPNDALVKRNEKLQQEVAALRNRLPILDVVFLDGLNHSSRFHFALTPTDKPQPIDIKEIEKKYPQVKPKSPGVDAAQFYPPELRSKIQKLNLMAGMDSVTKDECDRYNSDVSRFFNQCEQYNRKVESFREMMSRFVKFKLGLRNTGTFPDKNIDINIHFPDGMKILDSKELKNSFPERPQAPAPVQTLAQRLHDNIANAGNLVGRPLYSNAALRGPPFQGNVSNPDIKPTNSTDVKYHVGNIKHGTTVELGMLFLIFDSVKTVGSFRAEVKISSEELPHLYEGAIDFVDCTNQKSKALV
jgi:hypothetical protein